MIEPLPLARSEGSPEVLASPVFTKRLRALRVVMPMSKQRPLTEYSPFLPPSDVAAGLVVEIPADAGDAVGQGQGHAGIVGPFAGGQAVRAAATVAGHLGECARRLELDGGTQGIADGEANQCASLPVIELGLVVIQPDGLRGGSISCSCLANNLFRQLQNF